MTERARRVGRKTREEKVKWNQMTVLRFQMGGDIRHPRPPFGRQAFTHTNVTSHLNQDTIN